MPDRHMEKPLSLRLGALRPWVEERAEETGKPVRRVILDAIEQAALADGWEPPLAEPPPVPRPGRRSSLRPRRLS